MKRALIGLLVLFCVMPAAAQDSLNVRKIGQIPLTEAGAVVNRPGFAIVSDGYSGLQVIDIGNPLTPFIVGTCSTGVAWRVRVSGSYAYVTASNRLHIVDVSNPSVPTQVGSVSIYNWVVMDIAVEEPYAYVACWQQESLPHQPYPYCKLAILDISNPVAPAFVGYCTGGIGDTRFIAVEGDYAYLTAFISPSYRLWTINVSNPSAPVTTSVYTLSGARGEIVVRDSRAYIACGESGLAIVNVVSPSSPNLISTFDTPGEAGGIAVFGNYAFDYALVADGSAGIRIIDVTNLLAPIETGYYDTPGQATAVVVSEEYALLADQAYFGIYDFSAALSASPRTSVTPLGFALYPAYPNPFNSSTTLRLDLPRDVRARLVVYDVLGREARILTDGMLSSGAHSVRFDADGLSSGNYFIRLDAADVSQVQKVMLVK